MEGQRSGLRDLKDIFGDRLYIEVQHLSPGDGRMLREAERIGRELGVRLVSNEQRALPSAGGAPAPPHSKRDPHRLLADNCCSARDHHRRGMVQTSGGNAEGRFPDHPEWLQATLEIAERCNLQFELGKLIFPEFPVPDGESAFSYLWKLSFDGARKCYRPLRPEVLSRLTHELEVIEKQHLAPYFLLVWDIVEEARRRGIPAVARGSAASSMVTYCLGISRVCPLRLGVVLRKIFERATRRLPGH